MLEAQQEKVEALERVNREKETMLQKNQEIIKVLETSIEHKISLQKGEEEKIRQLDMLRTRKREIIDSEEEQVMKLDYTMSRKQALLELEQMKEQTLQQTIERKNALLETERARVEEIKKARLEQEALLDAEKEIVEALASSKNEKESLLLAEMKAMEELREALAEKEKLLVKNEMVQVELQKQVSEAGSIVEKEKELWETAKKVKDDSEALLRAADTDVRALENRNSQKAILLEKEEIIIKSLEKLKLRRRELASCGKLYAVVDTTLSISLLVKEALLWRNQEKRLLEDRKPLASSTFPGALPVVKCKIQNIIPAASDLFRKVLRGNDQKYMNKFVGYLVGMSKLGAEKHCSKPN
jgi:hypothetical protein